MFKDIPFLHWVVCLSFVICLAIPQNGLAIQILKLKGEEYLCEKVKKGKCYPCGEKKGISVSEGKLINKPNKSCPGSLISTKKVPKKSKEKKPKSAKTPTTSIPISDSKDTGIQVPQIQIPPTTPDPGSNSTIKNLNGDY